MSTKGLVTFTFDDGVSKNYPILLDILDTLKIKVTFFIIGNTLLKKENVTFLLDAHKRGHFIGNHSWSHPDLTKLSNDALDKEINDTSDKIESIIGIRPHYLRPPYGAINPNIHDKLTKLGYHILLWNVDAQDWNIKHYSDDMLKYYTDLFSSYKPTTHNLTILQHDKRLDSVKLVPHITNLVLHYGYKIVDVDTYVAA